MITRETVASKIAAWLRHDLALDELVNWAESCLAYEDFAETEIEILAPVLARLCAADVRNFGLTWEDCEQLLNRLGYVAHVEISAA